MKKAIIYIALVITTGSFAQQKDKALRKSNDFIFEGNTLVNDDFVAAEKEYRKALSEKPNNTIGAYNLGNAYYETGNFDEALLRHIEAAKLAITKAEKHKAYHNIGNVLMQKKQCKEAVEAFKNALRNDPTDEETRYNLVVAKECAEQQQQNEDQNKDKDKKDEKKKDDDKKKDDQKKDEGEKDKKDGDEKKDDKGKPKDEKENKKEGDPKNEKRQQQPQPGKLSPQQVKNLLEAMNNQEKKVQQKINAKKTKGEKVKTEKDW
jgi:Ca-activated chloride channel homolog